LTILSPVSSRDTQTWKKSDFLTHIVKKDAKVAELKMLIDDGQWSQSYDFGIYNYNASAVIG
jgi:hypothetical protein